MNQKHEILNRSQLNPNSKRKKKKLEGSSLILVLSSLNFLTADKEMLKFSKRRKKIPVWLLRKIKEKNTNEFCLFSVYVVSVYWVTKKLNLISEYIFSVSKQRISEL